MGYYSDYEVNEYDVDSDSFDDLSSDVMEFVASFPYDNLIYSIENNSKWYDYHDDMKEISLKFGDKIFHVKRSGEESLDIEDSYYSNGKMVSYVPKITYEKYNPEDLK